MNTVYPPPPSEVSKKNHTILVLEFVHNFWFFKAKKNLNREAEP